MLSQSWKGRTAHSFHRWGKWVPKQGVISQSNSLFSCKLHGTQVGDRIVNRLSPPSLGASFFLCPSQAFGFGPRQIWSCHPGQVLTWGFTNCILWDETDWCYFKILFCAYVIFRHAVWNKRSQPLCGSVSWSHHNWMCLQISEKCYALHFPYLSAREPSSHGLGCESDDSQELILGKASPNSLVYLRGKEATKRLYGTRFPFWKITVLEFNQVPDPATLGSCLPK